MSLLSGCADFVPFTRSVAPAFQVLAEHDSAVVERIMRCIQQRHVSMCGRAQQRRPCALVRVELISITSSKFAPALGSMPVPLSELRRRRDVFYPRVGANGRLLHSARPQTFHENSLAIAPRWRFIRTFDPDHLSLALIKRCSRCATPNKRVAARPLLMVGADAPARRSEGFLRSCVTSCPDVFSSS